MPHVSHFHKMSSLKMQRFFLMQALVSSDANSIFDTQSIFNIIFKYLLNK